MNVKTQSWTELAHYEAGRCTSPSHPTSQGATFCLLQETESCRPPAADPRAWSWFMPCMAYLVFQLLGPSLMPRISASTASSCSFSCPSLHVHRLQVQCRLLPVRLAGLRPSTGYATTSCQCKCSSQRPW